MSWVVMALGSGLAAAVASTVLLLTIAPRNDASLRVEIFKTGLTLGAGTGGVVALALNLRRQWHSEKEASEKWVTELYSKGVDQLASESAASRLGGLYFLERLADASGGHRQIIVDLICAYLRMPYAPQAVDSPSEIVGGRPAPVLLGDGAELARAQELQVRRAAQLILQKHLQPHTRGAVKQHWMGIHLDLTGATLIDFDLSGCQLERATFVGATFRPRDWPESEVAARFQGTVFEEDVTFEGAAFRGGVVFSKARFEGAAKFNWAVFNRDDEGSPADARFDEVGFRNAAEFSGVEFRSRTISFDKAEFNGLAIFEGTFEGDEIWFRDVTFRSEAKFPQRFAGNARFSRATFKAATGFPRRVMFSADAEFDEVTFEMDANFDGSVFEHGARFEGATFERAARFEGARFRQKANFDAVIIKGDAKFDRTSLDADAAFNNLTLGPNGLHDPPSGWTLPLENNTFLRW